MPPAPSPSLSLTLSGPQITAEPVTAVNHGVQNSHGSFEGGNGERESFLPSSCYTAQAGQYTRGQWVSNDARNLR